MEILASCSLEKSKGFNGKLEIEGSEGKNDKVSLNVEVLDESEMDVYGSVGNGVKFITFTGNKKATYCPTELEGRVFNQYSLEELSSGAVKPVMGVIDLVKLSDNFSDMKALVEYSGKYPNVRFIGGNLLQVEGVRIGRVEKNRERLPIVLNGVYDSFLEVSLDDLDGVVEKVSKARKSLEGSSMMEKKKGSGGGRKASSSEPKEKKIPKKVVALNSIFSSCEEEDF